MINSERVILEANNYHSQGYDGCLFPFPELIKQYQEFELVDVAPESLNLGDRRIYQPILDNYSKINTDFPPIVLGINNEIIDGFHRVAAAKYLGLPRIKAYRAIF